MSQTNPFLHSHLRESDNRGMSSLSLNPVPQLTKSPARGQSPRLSKFNMTGANAFDDSVSMNQTAFGSNNIDNNRFVNMSSFNMNSNNMNNMSNMDPYSGGGMNQGMASGMNQTMGGGTMGYGGGASAMNNNYPPTPGGFRSNDDITRAMALKIQQTSRSISEFFHQYDGYQGRQFQAWEIAIIFQDCITPGEADSITKQLAGQSDPRAAAKWGNEEQGIDYSKLINIIQRYMPNNMPPGNIGFQSQFVTKFKTPQISQYLAQINNYFIQSRQSLSTAFDQIFRSKTEINYQDFTYLLQKIGLNVPFNDLQSLFQYFMIQGGQSISKICFVQALKSMDQGGIQNQRNDYDTGTFRQPNLQDDRFGRTQDPHGNRPGTNPGNFNLQLNNPRGFNDMPNQGHPMMDVGGLLSPHQVQLHTRLRGLLKSLNIHSLINNFDYQMYEGKEIIPLDIFCDFLQMRALNLEESEIKYLVEKYLVRKKFGSFNDNFADIGQLEQDIFNEPEQQQTFTAHRSSRMTLKAIQQALSTYIKQSGGNMWQIFQELDVNKDNVISQMEFKLFLEKICCQAISDQQISEVFSMLDVTGDGKISYPELCRYFSQTSSTQAVVDPSHWAYRLFESIRYHVQVTQQPLTTLFGLNVAQFQGPQGSQKIPKDQFFQGLARLNLFLSRDEEARLLQLLDANQSNSWLIDFDSFSEMVGIGFDVAAHNRFVKQDIQQPQAYNQNKQTCKDLLRILQDNHVMLSLLEKQMEYLDSARSGYVDEQIFLNKISSIDQDRQLDIQAVKIFAQRFNRNQGNQAMISYREFIQKLRFEEEKYKIIETVFACFKSAMQHYQVATLQDLMGKFENLNQVKSFNLTLLDQTLQRIGVRLTQTMLDVLITEYAIDISTRELDFGTFNKDFQDYMMESHFVQKQQKSRIDNRGRTQEWANDIRVRVPVNPRDQVDPRRIDQRMGGGQERSGKKMNETVERILEHASLLLASKPQMSFTQLLQEHDITKTGVLSRMDFRTILGTRLGMTSDQVFNLESFYDPYNRDQIKIQEFLSDLKDYISDQRLRMHIVSVIQELDAVQPSSGGQFGLDSANALDRYSKDFEDIQKAIVLRNSNSFKWFEEHSRDRQTLSLQEFQMAIKALQLPYFKDRDIITVYQQLDQNKRGKIDIYAVDEVIRRFSKGSGAQIQDELLAKIVSAFNGDDAYVLTQLALDDRVGRGRINTMSFVNFVLKNAPTYQQFIENDVMFLAKSYEYKFAPNEVDYNKFHSDFVRVRRDQGIPTGTYHSSGAGGNFNKSSSDWNRQGAQMGPSSKNPFMPNYSESNTKAGVLKTIRPQRFVLNLQPEVTDALIKATYLEDMLVEDFFLQYAARGSHELTYAEWEMAITSRLDLGWDSRKTQAVFEEIDRAFNQGQRRQRISPESIDQAVFFCSTRGIEDLHFEILSEIGRIVSSKGASMRNELQSYDTRHAKILSIAQIEEIIRGRLKLPVTHLDIRFLCKRYIENVPGQVQYEKLLDDLETFNKGKFGSSSELGVVCDFIRKACFVRNQQLVTHFRKHMKQQGLLSEHEFEKSLQDLELVPTLVTALQASTLFKQMDRGNYNKVSLDEIGSFIDQQSHKTTEQFQNETLDQIVSVGHKKGLNIESVFKQDEVRGKLSAHSFQTGLKRLFDVNIIDGQLLARKYGEANNNVNLARFIQDYKSKNAQGHFGDPHNNHNRTNTPSANDGYMLRVQNILRNISSEVITRNLQLSQRFASFDTDRRGGGLISRQDFIGCLDFFGLIQSQDDKIILAEYYSEPIQRNQGIPQVSYLKFLGDLKKEGSVQASQKVNLTGEQKQLYKQCQQHILSNAKQGDFVGALNRQDNQGKGYLRIQDISAAYHDIGLRLGPKQITTITSVLETNQHGEFNYNQMIELMFGADQAKQLTHGGLPGSTKARPTAQYVMPKQPVDPINRIMGNIGLRVIQSNINIEDLLKRKISTVQAQQFNPRATEQSLIEILKDCKVLLNTDERGEMAAFMLSKRDRDGMVNVCEFLQAIGLPPQTLGAQASKALPKRILNEKELAEAQNIIRSLRQDLEKKGRVVQQVFQQTKGQNDVAIQPISFRMKLAAEFGQVGKSITDQQVDLLTYYLSQEVPGQISYKKLFLAFSLTDREQPLKQEGAEEIKRYETKIKDQLKKSSIPLEVIDLVHFMKKNQLKISQIFKSIGPTTKFLARKDFELSLQEVGFKAKDMNRLVEVLDDKGTRTQISVDRLNDYIRKASPEGRSINAAVARDRYAGFDPRVRQHLTRISEFMKRRGLTLKQVHELMDIDRDGKVDKLEFVNSLQSFQIPGIQPSDCGMIFDAIDVNNGGTLSVHEFGLFIEGAKATKNSIMEAIDPKVIEEMKKEINLLFQQFDDNGDGKVTADEVFKAMMSLGQRITIQDAQQMIDSVDTRKKGSATLEEFIQLMLPKMKEELCRSEESMEDMRAMFVEADVDCSGTLSVDEIYSVILKMGAEVSLDELVELMNEIDVDRDGELDIDEFVALMSFGEEMQFKSAGSKQTLHHIKMSKRLNPLDFLKCFKDMPMNFVPSFIGEKWARQQKSLPSSVFKPQIDPKTMLYKDLLPVFTENLAPNQQVRDYQPRLRPISTQLGCTLKFETAEGVPLPKGGAGFDRSQIVKRAVRVGLFDTTKQDFLYNAVQVGAVYNEVDEDIWAFQQPKENGLNPVIFRVADKDLVCKADVYIIFELVIYVKFGDKVREMSCGWCQLSPNAIDRGMTHRLPIKGGSPTAEVIIKDEDVHTKRTGLKYIMKKLQTKINSQLVVEVELNTKFSDDVKFHTDLLPAVCFIQKPLLYLVSGFRNYCGEKLLRESLMGTFKQPHGDVIISTFPKILDNPDMCEKVAQIWCEDVLSSISGKQKQNVQFLMMKAKDFVQRLYPVVYSEAYQYSEAYPTNSACGDQFLYRTRENLIIAALRYGSAQHKTKVTQPLEALTMFKPFTVREMEFEVWETSRAKQDRFVKQYEDLGLIGQGSVINTPMNGDGFGNFGSGPGAIGARKGSGYGQETINRGAPRGVNPLSLSNAMAQQFDN